MTRTTQRELKQGVKSGIYTQYNGQDIRKYDIIRFSRGVYGANGCLIQDTDTGELYAITSRSTELFKFI